MMTDEELAEMTRREIAEALGLPPAKVSRDAFLKGELGAESIDFIDLTFRFEKALGRPLTEQEIFRSSRPDGDVSVEEIVAALEVAQRPPLAS